MYVAPMNPRELLLLLLLLLLMMMLLLMLALSQQHHLIKQPVPLSEFSSSHYARYTGKVKHLM